MGTDPKRHEVSILRARGPSDMPPARLWGWLCISIVLAVCLAQPEDELHDRPASPELTDERHEDSDANHEGLGEVAGSGGWRRRRRSAADRAKEAKAKKTALRKEEQKEKARINKALEEGKASGNKAVHQNVPVVQFKCSSFNTPKKMWVVKRKCKSSRRRKKSKKKSSRRSKKSKKKSSRRRKKSKKNVIQRRQSESASRSLMGRSPSPPPPPPPWVTLKTPLQMAMVARGVDSEESCLMTLLHDSKEIQVSSKGKLKTTKTKNAP